MIFISGRVTPADVTNLEMEKSDAKNGTVAINGSSLADKGDNGSNGKSEDEKKKEKEEVKLVGFFEVVGTLSTSKTLCPLGNFSCFFLSKHMATKGRGHFPMLI